MANALAAMDERCGSAEGYLTGALGIGEAERSALKGKFLQ